MPHGFTHVAHVTFSNTSEGMVLDWNDAHSDASSDVCHALIFCFHFVKDIHGFVLDVVWVFAQINFPFQEQVVDDLVGEVASDISDDAWICFIRAEDFFEEFIHKEFPGFLLPYHAVFARPQEDRR